MSDSLSLHLETESQRSDPTTVLPACQILYLNRAEFPMLAHNRQENHIKTCQVFRNLTGFIRRFRAIRDQDSADLRTVLS